MRTIITVLLCISFAYAQQIPTMISSKAKNDLESQAMQKKWQEKLKQFNTPEFKKSLIDSLQKNKSSLTSVSAKVIEASTCYEIPFPEGIGASKGNTIELAIANSSAFTAEGVKVEATNIPSGIQFKEKTITLTTLKSKEEQTASFTFSVEKTAKVNKEDTLRFTITDKTGQKWTKEIKISITPPTTYELLQNYPNPFNPTTTIEYQLPGTGTRYSVSLKIYDAIGREVAHLVSEQQEPGYYQKTFNANRYASGMYIYRLVATDEQNKQHVFQKKMVLLK